MNASIVITELFNRSITFIKDNKNTKKLKESFNDEVLKKYKVTIIRINNLESVDIGIDYDKQTLEIRKEYIEKLKEGLKNGYDESVIEEQEELKLASEQNPKCIFIKVWKDVNPLHLLLR